MKILPKILKEIKVVPAGWIFDFPIKVNHSEFTNQIHYYTSYGDAAVHIVIVKDGLVARVNYILNPLSSTEYILKNTGIDIKSNHKSVFEPEVIERVYDLYIKNTPVQYSMDYVMSTYNAIKLFVSFTVMFGIVNVLVFALEIPVDFIDAFATDLTQQIKHHL